MIVPHPNHIVMHLEQRHVDLLAESAREHRARRLERTTRPHWADFLATLVGLIVVTLLLKVGAEAFISPAFAVVLP